MALCVSPYDHGFFNSMPRWPASLPNHEALGGDEWIRKTFGPLFRKHQVQNIFGIQLLHQHFLLEDDEHLTDVNGTSTPWKSTTGIEPSSWAIDSTDKPKPLEFHVPHEGTPVPNWTVLQDFLKAFVQLLDSLGIRKLYGLALYPGDGFPGRVEMTIGRCNVNLTPFQVWQSNISTLSVC